MEDALVPKVKKNLVVRGVVLILVLMEDALVLVKYVQTKEAYKAS